MSTSVMLDGSLQDPAAACWKDELPSGQSHTRLHPTPRRPFIAGSIPQLLLLLLFLLLDVLLKVRNRSGCLFPAPPLRASLSFATVALMACQLCLLACTCTVTHLLGSLNKKSLRSRCFCTLQPYVHMRSGRDGAEEGDGKSAALLIPALQWPLNFACSAHQSGPRTVECTNYI